MPLKEFELLELLMRNAGRVLTRGQLIDRVWGSDYFGDTKTLDVHIKRIRSKIEVTPSEPVQLVTVRGLGATQVDADSYSAMDQLNPTGPNRDAFLRVDAFFDYGAQIVQAALGPFMSVDKIDIRYLFNG